MNCNKLRSNLISGVFNEDVKNHIAECESCREVYQKVNDTMAVLDMEVAFPESLAASILEKQSEVKFPKVRRLNYMSIIQVAAAILFGVFIGHKFGKIAGDQPIKTKQDPINQYFKAHHFNVDMATFKAPSLYTKNQHD